MFLGEKHYGGRVEAERSNRRSLCSEGQPWTRMEAEKMDGFNVPLRC